MDPLEYIDDYFKKDLSEEDNREFEKKILEDRSFAEEVAFYYSTMIAAKEQIAEEKKTRFREIYDLNKSQVRIGTLKKLWPYLAAAAAIAGIFFSIFIISHSSTPQKLSEKYISENFQTLGVNMGNSEDALQTGINYFNEGKLTEALQQFENIIRLDSTGFIAKQYAGIACLRLKQYDKALGYFGQLENYTNLRSNPAKLYHAITLLGRNRPGDKQQAYTLLQDVVNNNLEGKKTAGELLDKF